MRYDAALVFLIFSLTAINSITSAVFIVLTTLLFVIGYLAIVRDFSRKYDWFFWYLLLAYILAYIILYHVNFFWYFFFLSNLLIYKYHDSWLSKRFISFHISILLSLLLIFFLPSYSTDEKLQLLILPVFIYVMTFIGKREYNDRLLRAKMMEQHKTINLLAAENERNRIGRDLHDSLGHTFAMMTLKTELALKLLEKKEVDSVRKELLELNQISRQSMQEVRQIISNLKFRRFDEELLSLEEMFTSSAITLKIDNQLANQVLSPVLESSLIMIVRELTNNVIKHSLAQKASLKIWREQGICIRMEDDGLGFSEWTGQELHTIRDRLEMIGGSIELTSPKNPTVLLVRLSEK
ncbi:sensor histidine kinase [Streptococcus loxodontisalivarius]